jgi:hypothetical protein
MMGNTSKELPDMACCCNTLPSRCVSGSSRDDTSAQRMHRSCTKTLIENFEMRSCEHQPNQSSPSRRCSAAGHWDITIRPQLTTLTESRGPERNVLEHQRPMSPSFQAVRARVHASTVVLQRARGRVRETTGKACSSRLSGWSMPQLPSPPAATTRIRLHKISTTQKSGVHCDLLKAVAKVQCPRAEM